jgi:hypothetical protein
VDVFLKGVKNEQALTGCDSLFSLSLGDEALDETGQSTEEKQEKPLSLKYSPLLEVRSVKDGESGQKVSLVEVQRFMNPTGSFRGHGETTLWILEAFFENLLELLDVCLTGSGGRQEDPGTLDGETVIRGKAGLFEGASKVPEGAPEVIARSGLRAFAPQKSGQVITGEPLLRLTGQVDEKGLLLLS